MINLANIQWTENQKLIGRAILSMFGSALLAAGQAAYQYITQHGLINIQQVLLIFVGVLWVTFSTALAAYIPAHIQQELQDLQDFKAQVMAQPPTSTQPAQPLVVIHTQNATPLVSSASNAASVVTVPAAAQPVPMSANIMPNVPPVQLPASVQTNVAYSMLVPQSIPQTVPVPGDILGDVPASPTTMPDRVTGVVPVYGASGK